MPDKADPVEVDTARQQQHTGNHDKPGAERNCGTRHGGTRYGAENLEPVDSADRGKGVNKTQ